MVTRGRGFLPIAALGAAIGLLGGCNNGNDAVANYQVGGTVTGLSGTGLVLQNHNGDDVIVKANGAFTFPTQIGKGGTYSVTVKTQPNGPSQACEVANGSGSINASNVSNVGVSCKILGSVSLSVSPAGPNIIAGDSATVTATVTRMGGYAGAVVLAASGAPNGVTVSGGTIEAAATALDITVTTTAAAVAGTSNISISGTASGVTIAPITLPVTVEVMPTDVAGALTFLQKTGRIPTLDTATIVAGTDANADGVRDDIERYVQSLPDSAAQKKAATGLAKALQSSATANVTDQAAVMAAAKAMDAALACLWELHDRDTATSRVKTLEAFSMNTIERIRIYDQFNYALNGVALDLPVGVNCNG
jgi:trimeric autotransporter adhesin